MVEAGKRAAGKRASALKAAKAVLRKAHATLSELKSERAVLLSKLGKRAVIIHRQHVHEAGQERLRSADEETLLKQTAFMEYSQMSEGEAIGKKSHHTHMPAAEIGQISELALLPQPKFSSWLRKKGNLLQFTARRAIIPQYR